MWAPTRQVTRASTLSKESRIVGEVASLRIQRAVTTATMPTVDEPRASALVRRWRLPRAGVARWTGHGRQDCGELTGGIARALLIVYSQ